jgi:hypothetical protein
MESNANYNYSVPGVLSPDPTWEIFDATKLQDFMTCPRKYFYRYILGWRPDTPNIHLEFGSAWHLAMEHLLREGKGPKALIEACNLFCDHYDQHFDAAQDLLNAPKNKDNALRALAQYCDFYYHDPHVTSVIDTEVAGTVPLGTDTLHFKIDAIVRTQYGYAVLDHKTASRFSSLWDAEWTMKMQVHIYTHVLYMLFPPQDVFGFIVNGVSLTNPPRIKKDGTPYVGDRDNEFRRVVVRRTPAHMNVWFTNTSRLLKSLRKEHELLSRAKPSDDALDAFPLNTESCTRYGVCPYHQLCSVDGWANPLRRCSTTPLGFKQEFWNPKDSEAKARKVVQL